jgi:hypothetical protein
MNADDAKKCVAYLVGLFPNQLTKDLLRFAAAEFAAFEVVDVRKAAREHRGRFEFVKWPELLEGCRLAAELRTGGQSRAAAKAEDFHPDNARREGSWCDVRRRQTPYLRGAGDVEVVLRVYRGWWFKCARSDSYRSQIEASCRGQLIATGMSEADAATWAATVFEESPEYFRQVLGEVRQAAAEPAQEVMPV